MKHALWIAGIVAALASACGHGSGGSSGGGGGVSGGGGGGVSGGGGDGGGVVTAAPPEKVVQLNAPGELVNIEASFVPGYVTIVDFWADWCGACKTMEEKFMAVIADEPRVLVRKVDVGDGDTPVAHHYDVGPLPHLRVYDTRGQLRYVLMNQDALTTGEKALEVLAEDTAATP